MDINLTLIGQTIAMIVFVWFCVKFIWPPIIHAIEERQKQIAEGLAAAEKGEENLAKARAEADEIVGDARKQATSILDQAHARANEIVAEGKSDGVKERERQLTAAKAEIDQDAWDTLHADTSRPFDKPKSGRIAVKVINHLGDEVMKVFRA